MPNNKIINDLYIEQIEKENKQLQKDNKAKQEVIDKLMKVFNYAKLYEEAANCFHCNDSNQEFKWLQEALIDSIGEDDE